MNQNIGELLALLAALFGAVSSVLYNRLGNKSGSDLIAYIRMVIAAPLMCSYALLADGSAIFTSNLNNIIQLFFSGAIGFFVTDIFMFRAYVLWGARETMVVLCLAPVLSGIGAWFLFDEILTVRQITGSLLSVLGIVIMTLADKGKKNTAVSKGIIYAVLAAVFQFVSDMSAKNALIGMPWVSSSAIRAVGGLFAWIVFGLFMCKHFFDKIDIIKEPKFFALLCLAVLTGTALGTTCVMGALEYAPAGIVTSLKQTAPVFIIPYEVLILKKKLSTLSLAGTLLSVVGVFLLF